MILAKERRQANSSLRPPCVNVAKLIDRSYTYVFDVLFELSLIASLPLRVISLFTYLRALCGHDEPDRFAKSKPSYLRKSSCVGLAREHAAFSATLLTDETCC